MEGKGIKEGARVQGGLCKLRRMKKGEVERPPFFFSFGAVLIDRIEWVEDQLEINQDNYYILVVVGDGLKGRKYRNYY